MLPAQGFRPQRADWLQALAVALALFALYAATSSRTVALEDDGLFILSSYFLGIEHPPGYPLFTLIGHLFTWLPFGSVAYRVHLASALFGALSGAAAWLCARTLIAGRLPAYLAALALGVSPVFWSQAIIAEVYTLNTFFFLVLVFLGLRACPPGAPPASPPPPRGTAMLLWMALIFGLSLSNHYPLMLLAAPAFLVLLWPLRRELVRHFGSLAALVIVGLLPYAWLVGRSWAELPISFYGPLETIPEVLWLLSRQGYAGVDQSLSAGWMDRVKFFEFFGGQLLLQFAVVGTLLAAAGFLVQWRVLGRRVASFLTIAFLMPSVVLLLLLRFDYDSVRAHVFHVFPLPAYAVGALWLGLGFSWAAQRYTRARWQASTAAAACLALIFALGARINLLPNDWGARYAQAVLAILPKNAVVIVTGDPDLAPIAYFHMIENRRPDITLVEANGLILGNRLFHPLRTSEEAARRIVEEMIDQTRDPVGFTLSADARHARRDGWLYVEVDKSSTDVTQVTVDIREEALRFFEESMLEVDRNAWVAFIQGELRRHYAKLLAQSLPRGKPPSERERRHLELLAKDFYGALGIAEGLMAHKESYSAGVVAGFLDKARQAMPSDAPKEHLSRFFYIRAVLRANLHDDKGALQDLDIAVRAWTSLDNPAFAALEEHYRRTGNEGAAKEVQERMQQLKSRKRR